ncbi:MAG: YbbR-like domain-containing protein [Acutalibacteraceae bacterium]
MMKKQAENKNIIHNIFFNNKYLMIFCLVISIVLWAAVKINYSDDTVRTISDIKISVNSNDEETQYTAFYDESEFTASVEITGKAYNINAHAISKDDIIVETVNTFVDSAGYKTLTLTARISDTVTAPGVEITKISPSTVTVYYDKEVTDTFNVVARLDTTQENLVGEGYIVGQPVPSLNTVEVKGPATILSQMKTVYFDTVIDKSRLPVTAPTEFPADVTFELESAREMKYLRCLSVDDKTNPATVTLPVYIKKEVPVTVKFVNQPTSYNENMPEYQVTPSSVEIICNPKDSEKYTEINVGTIDFKNLSNTVNTFTLPYDSEKSPFKITDKEIESFEVEVDMTEMSTITFSYADANVLFLNTQSGFNYALGTGGNIDQIVIVGPKKSIDKLSADNIQVEINVSALNVSGSTSQLLDVSNISINNPEVNDCWVYGEYTAFVTATEAAS